MDKKKLEAMLREATVDCYDEDEEFAGVCCTLEDSLHFPLQAKALGKVVEVVGLDETRSSLRRGIIARVRKGKREYRVALAELEFIDPDPVSAEWLAMFRYWLG